MGIRMFDVDPSQAAAGLDGQVAKEDTIQGEGPSEARNYADPEKTREERPKVVNRPKDAPRFGYKFEDGKPVPKNPGPAGSDAIYNVSKDSDFNPNVPAAADTPEAAEAREFAAEVDRQESEIEETNHGLRYAIRPIKSWVLGRIEFPDEIVQEINDHIDNVIIPADSSYAQGLVGQLKNGEKSAQLNFPFDDEVGKTIKTILDQIGTTYLKNGYDRDAQADCYQCWTNHAYAGDYNPLHDHGVQTPAGLSGFLWLQVPPCIEELPEFNPSINNAGGGIDGFTQLVWGQSSRRDIMQLKAQTEDYVKPVVGTMLVFPQWLKHQVMPFFGEGERRSMAMNWNVFDSDKEMRKYMSERELAQYNAQKEKLASGN